MNLSASGQLNTIDISKATGYGSIGNVFESFYRLGKDGKITPGLAESSKVSADGKTWTFKLRDAKWSNGDKITAQDFVYSWRRTVDPKTVSPYAYLFYGVENAQTINEGEMPVDKLGIKAVGKDEVVITLTKPNSYFKTLMTYPLFGPQSEKIVQKYGKKYGTNSKYMVYSGPFKVKDWDSTSDTWSFVKNNQYWDKKVVKLHKINYQVIKNSNTAYQLFQRGKLDLAPLSSEQVKNLKDKPEFKQYSYSYIAYMDYNYNDSNELNRKALNNKNIRLALSQAIDREILTKKVFGDGSNVPKGFVASDLARDPSNKKDFADEQKVAGTMEYNEKLARENWKKGLKELGVKSLNITLLSSNEEPNSEPLMQYLQSQYTKVLPGIKITVQNIPGNSALSKARKGDYDIFVTNWGGDFKDPITFLQVPVSNTSYNYGKYSNEEYDSLIKKAENEDANDPNKRWEDLVEAAKILNRDQAVTPLYQQTISYMQNKNVKGIIQNTAGTQWNYKYTYIK
ncbi:peptide ABC transporter substrate-binding protein [Ligilactobacillus salivarius]|uniref:Peptide ABC transporter substrate-binding protein n=1 Tax=Ligilactobacillus salivarius TaxID=1624 RepID=A0AAW7N8C4_9LACO|nr:peptide ABC transporter substrate-binding protein [Ligilactobacillus salivarius]MDN4834326.1 peptide ABC transporter substrate-binding protein [Ligilactobacillus salivarius]